MIDCYFGDKSYLLLIQLCRGRRPGDQGDLVALNPPLALNSENCLMFLLFTHSASLSLRESEEEVWLRLAKMIPSFGYLSVNICGVYFKLVLKIINVYCKIFSNTTSISIEHRKLCIPNQHNPIPLPMIDLLINCYKNFMCSYVYNYAYGLIFLNKKTKEIFL